MVQAGALGKTDKSKASLLPTVKTLINRVRIKIPTPIDKVKPSAQHV